MALTITRYMLARTLPFALFMAFILLDQGLRLLASTKVLTFASDGFLFIYPIKITAVVATLWYFRTHYSELRWHDLYQWKFSLFSIISGLIVFILWIHMTWPFAVQGEVHGYDPTSIHNDSARMAIIASRLIGASIVVPIMEELFWRSFFIRYVITREFEKIPIGTFTISSFIITSIFFGLEHNLWLAGILAGIVYNYVLYQTKSVTQCILAHAVTNGSLGVYIILTHSWSFW